MCRASEIASIEGRWPVSLSWIVRRTSSKKLSSSLYCRNCSSNCGASRSRSSAFRVTNGFVASDARKTITFRGAPTAIIAPKAALYLAKIRALLDIFDSERIYCRADSMSSKRAHPGEAVVGEARWLIINSEQPTEADGEFFFVEFDKNLFGCGQLLKPRHVF